MLQLYHYPSSVCSQKVRIVLAEKDLEWRSRVVDIHRGEQFRAEYVALNPDAAVPTLVDGGCIVVESTVIGEYLEDRWPRPPLRPASPAAAAAMRCWTKRVDEGLHQACGTLTAAATAGERRASIAALGMSLEDYLTRIPDPQRRERQRQALQSGARSPEIYAALDHHRRVVDRMAAALASGPFLAGEHYSLADAALTPYLVRLDRLGLAEVFVPHKPVACWYAAMQQRKSFSQAITRFDDSVRLTALAKGGCDLLPLLRPEGLR